MRLVRGNAYFLITRVVYCVDLLSLTERCGSRRDKSVRDGFVEMGSKMGIHEIAGISKNIWKDGKRKYLLCIKWIN